MALNFIFWLKVFGLWILLPSMSMGCFMFSMNCSGVSFLNSSHSVTIMQQSAFLRHSIAVEAYLIVFLKIVFATGTATGSYAVILRLL